MLHDMGESETDYEIIDFDGEELESAKIAIKLVKEGKADIPMKGILQYCTDPIVSCDVIGNPHSSVFDANLTNVLGGKGTFVKCVAWYDNEWGYSQRVVDLAKFMLQQ